MTIYGCYDCANFTNEQTEAQKWLSNFKFLQLSSRRARIQAQVCQAVKPKGLVIILLVRFI